MKHFAPYVVLFCLICVQLVSTGCDPRPQGQTFAAKIAEIKEKPVNGAKVQELVKLGNEEAKKNKTKALTAARMGKETALAMNNAEAKGKAVACASVAVLMAKLNQHSEAMQMLIASEKLRSKIIRGAASDSEKIKFLIELALAKGKVRETESGKPSVHSALTELDQAIIFCRNLKGTTRVDQLLNLVGCCMQLREVDAKQADAKAKQYIIEVEKVFRNKPSPSDQSGYARSLVSIAKYDKIMDGMKAAQARLKNAYELAQKIPPTSEDTTDQAWPVAEVAFEYYTLGGDANIKEARKIKKEAMKEGGCVGTVADPDNKGNIIQILQKIPKPEE